MRLKKSYALLLVLLLTPLVLVGVVQSVAPPTIYVNQSSYGITVYGNNWAPYTDVTIYYDVEDADHMIAVVTANYGGYFQTSIPTDYIPTVGAHTVIAVQGADKATAVHNVGTTAPPDDRLLNPILNIQTKLNDVDLEVKAIEAKLDAGGSFYNFVNAWFITVDNKINTVDNKVDTVEGKVDDVDDKIDTRMDTLENKLDDVEDQLDDKLDILAYYEGEWDYPGNAVGMLVPGTYIQADNPVLFTVIYQMSNLDDEDWYFFLDSSAANPAAIWDEDWGTHRNEHTFPGTWMNMTLLVSAVDPDFLINWGIMIRGTPETNVWVVN